jgi:NADH-quinone oxidoreductase subunit M
LPYVTQRHGDALDRSRGGDSADDRIERKTGTLELRDLGGLAKTAPSLAFLFGLAAMASIGLPGLANFAGEVMVFASGFQNWNWQLKLGWVQIGTICAIWGVVISAVYMLRAFRRIFQGQVVPATAKAADLEPADKTPAVLLAVVLLAVGLYPNLLLGFIKAPEGPAQSAQEAAPIPTPAPSFPEVPAHISQAANFLPNSQ